MMRPSNDLPGVYLRHIFKRLPAAETVEQLDALLLFNLDGAVLAQDVMAQ